jgi:hypothetical protein
VRFVLVCVIGCAADSPETDATPTDAPADTDVATPPAPPDDTDEPPPPDEPCDLFVQVGEGEVYFRPLASFDEVEMVHVPQGGWHVVWSVMVSGTEPTAQLHGTLTDLDSGVLVSDITYNVALDVVDACIGESIGQYGYLDVSGLASGSLDTPPELLAGHTLQLRVVATDFLGTTASDDVLVIAVPDPENVD